MARLPKLDQEKKLWEKGYLVIGVDEVGRGAFAGPLVVGAVAFEPTSNRSKIKELENLGINDSKKLTREKREKLAKEISERALCYATASISVPIINRVGIGKATHMAVRKVVGRIKYKVSSIKQKKPEKLNAKYIIHDTKYFLLIDAFYIKYVRGVGLANQKAIIHGDELSLSIAAASIIAKVYRDNLMRKLALKYPSYNLHQNKGYGTKDHRFAIREFGKTTIHREAFVRAITQSIDLIQK